MQQSKLLNQQLTQAEQKLEQSLAHEEWLPVEHDENWKSDLAELVAHTLELRRSKKITVRVNQSDLVELKAKAKHQNIPYQTLLGSLIRAYVQGELSGKV